MAVKSVRLSVGFLLLLFSLVSSSAATVVHFHTKLGDLDVELYDTDKPVTVQNFLLYVQGGSYNTNMFFHRVEPNFVLQGGGFEVVERGTTNADVVSIPTFPPITNEFNVGKFYSNTYGTIAMAKTSDPNSATSQFFFNLADNSAALDNPNNSGGFTVFGRVILGTNVLNRFLVGPNNYMLKEVNLGGPFAELPVLYSADLTNLTFEELFANLIYVSINAAPPYRPLKATYNGLFQYMSTNQALTTEGFITLATTAGAHYTGSLRLGGARYAFSGSFDNGGFAIATAKSGSREPLVVRLLPDLTLGTDKLVGSVSSSQWAASVQAYRAPFDGRVNRATNFMGKYTLTLPSSGLTNAPSGYGFAALSVSAAGQVTLKGALADGTPVSQSVPLGLDGNIPFYSSVYANGGFVSGWGHIQPDRKMIGSLLWRKPAAAKGLFPAGFLAPSEVAGGPYQAPAPGTNLLNATDSFIFGGDSSTLAFTNSLILKAGNKLLNTSTNKLTVTLTSATGLFSGTVKPPGSTLSLPFKGALWQGRGYGYFLDGSQSGWVLVQP